MKKIEVCFSNTWRNSGSVKMWLEYLSRIFRMHIVVELAKSASHSWNQQATLGGLRAMASPDGWSNIRRANRIR